MSPLWLLPLVLSGAGSRKVKIAIPDMRLAGGIPADTASLLTDVIAKSMNDVRPDRMQVITSTMMQSILGLERQKELLGCKEDSACLVEVGNALGADLLASCTLGKLGGTYLTSCSLIDLGKTVADVTVQDSFSGPDDGLIGSARRVGTQLGTAVSARLKAQDAAVAVASAPGTAAPTSKTPAAKSVAAPPAQPPPPLKAFDGRVNDFPYDDYPPPQLDPATVARYLRAHP